jgi:transposase
MKAAGISNKEISAKIGITEKTASQWAKQPPPPVGQILRAALLAKAESMARDEKTPPVTLALFAIALKMWE